MKVALVCVAKNEDNYIDEWINYNLKLGFDDIFIYENDWEYEINNEHVHIMHTSGIGKQMTSYNDFISKNHQNYDWAAFIDVDEFLVLKKHHNIKEFISDYSEYNSIAINWAVFSDGGLKNVVDGNYGVVDRFTKRWPHVDHHIKTISKLLPALRYDHPHFSNVAWVNTEFEKGEGPFNENGHDDIAQLNHYFSKTLEEFHHKIARGRASLPTRVFRDVSEYIELKDTDVDDYFAYNFKNDENKQ